MHDWSCFDSAIAIFKFRQSGSRLVAEFHLWLAFDHDKDFNFEVLSLMPQRLEELPVLVTKLVDLFVGSRIKSYPPMPRSPLSAYSH